RCPIGERKRPICRALQAHYRPFGKPSVTGVFVCRDGNARRLVCTECARFAHTAHTREDRMRRLNFLDDEPWDEVDEQQRRRWFGHPLGTDMLGASLTELSPGSPGGHMHMHYGLE